MTCHIVYNSGRRFDFPRLCLQRKTKNLISGHYILVSKKEKLKCNGQRLRRAKGFYIFIYNDFLNLDPSDSIDTCDLDCSDSKILIFCLIIICGGKFICYFVWIVIAKQLI